ncbi:PPP4R2-domain-containing protein [Ephemerocybe angulata]|uniref:PPP4R2-domain-containing protein n=1 Tax=Ephemerocybe angulata TaxID=980116 RepID=A0A8H6IIB7_9AGAR|nr:PPP4R2-domain-containing protein [Tulosesus angulatus]
MSDHNAILQDIATSDDISGTDWDELRQIIRTKLEQNVSQYNLTPPPPPPPFNATPSTHGGLRLPPFPPKKLSQLHMYDPPLSYMNEEQVKDALQAVFDQLESFDEGPPFTIQRLCELLLDPKRHYKSVGKYLRAVEKSILVTSSHNSFPSEPSTSSNPSNGHSNANNMPTNPSSTSTIAFATQDTKMFAFKHKADSRVEGQKYREGTQPPTSPTPEPETPLLMSAALPLKGGKVKAEPVGEVGETGAVGLGMVDELDDPNPGHMSDGPTPLTIAGGAKPFLGSLQERFVKSESIEEDQKEQKEPSSSANPNKKVKIEQQLIKKEDELRGLREKAKEAMKEAKESKVKKEEEEKEIKMDE